LKLLPRGLFGRSAALLLVIFVGVQGLALGVVWYAVVAPLAERSAGDLAARIALAAQTWVELPPVTRTDYEIELSLHHELELGAVTGTLHEPAAPSYFGNLLEAALRARLGQPVSLMRGPDPAWSWLDLELAGHRLRLGYRHATYEIAAPLAAAAAILAGALFTVLAALVMARRFSRQLRRLAASAAEVGQGRTPLRLPEQGAEEIRALNAAFNRMADAVQALLENRTVLLAGISHDLRTPLTRLRLALSMLDGGDAALLRRMEADIEEMNRLVGEMLDLARALQAENPAEHDLTALLDDLAACARVSAPAVTLDWQSPGPCRRRIGAVAFRRIVANLLGNAQRYASGAPVTLSLACTVDAAVVRVLDRGPGIPATQREAVFRPFYRLEASRARDTGGSGLGLAIARQLADAYGWRLALHERQGGGLIAELILPG